MLEPLLVGWAVWLCPVCQELVSRGEGAREGDAHCAGSLVERSAHERTAMKPVDVVQMDLARSLIGQNRRLRAALPDPEKLLLIADWLDTIDAQRGSESVRGRQYTVNPGEQPDAVQRDLRRWANNAIAAANLPTADPPPTSAEVRLLAAGALVDDQANDVGLWEEADCPQAAHLQAELRQLHALLEAA